MWLEFRRVLFRSIFDCDSAPAESNPGSPKLSG